MRETHTGLFIEVNADGVEVIAVHDANGQSFLQTGKLRIGELHFVGCVFEIAANDGCRHVDDLVGALVYLMKCLYLPSFGSGDWGDDGTVLKQSLALFLGEAVEAAGFELWIEHHIDAVVVHADEREAGAGMDFLAAFVGDADGSTGERRPSRMSSIAFWGRSSSISCVSPNLSSMP